MICSLHKSRKAGKTQKSRSLKTYAISYLFQRRSRQILALNSRKLMSLCVIALLASDRVSLSLQNAACTLAGVDNWPLI